MNEINNAFSKRLSHLMAINHITAKQLGILLDVSTVSIAHYMTGLNIPPVEKMVRLADFFGVSMDYLLGREDCPDSTLQESCRTLHRSIMERDLKNNPYPVQRTKRARTAVTVCEAPWPYNMLSVVFGDDPSLCIPMTQDQKDGLEQAMRTLSDRQKDIILRTYKDGNTLEAVGRDYHVTRERIRQVQAQGIRILRSPSNKALIRYGLKGCAIQRREQKCKEREKKLEQYEKTLSRKEKVIFVPQQKVGVENGLSVRAYHLLVKNRIYTASDLEEVVKQNGMDYLWHIQGMGVKSYYEIIYWHDKVTGTILEQFAREF